MEHVIHGIYFVIGTLAGGFVGYLAARTASQPIAPAPRIAPAPMPTLPPLRDLECDPPDVIPLPQPRPKLSLYRGE